MAPIISDFYDTLKDVIFGALCLQSEHLMIQILGVVSWSYLFLFHTWFLVVYTLDIESLPPFLCVLCCYCSLFCGAKGTLDEHCFAELASSHLSVLLTSPKVPGE